MANWIKRRRHLILLGSILFGMAGCMDEPSSADVFEDCRYSAPKPIFKDGLESVSTHHFQLEKEKAVESLAFDDGLQLLILQTGCDYIRQEFRFEWDGGRKGAPDSFWIGEAADKFYRLGSLGPAYIVYHSIARALEERNGEIRLGQNIELQAGFYVKVDNLNSRGRGALLAISLSEQPLVSAQR